MAGWLCFHTSQLMQKVTCAPEANSSSAITWVGVSTGSGRPLRGDSAVTMRSGKPMLDMAKTRCTGPIRLTRVLKIIGRHVEDRAAAGLEEEFRIGMPMLHAVRHQEGRSREDAADRAIIDELAGEASAGAEEGVRRAAEVKAAGLRLVD